MQVITFYSYKGGVGRTLACANFGIYLAKTGQKVVLADMDFEAPGLDSKFPSIKPADLATGMLEQFSAFQEGREIPQLNAVEIELPSEVAQAGGRLQVIPAGDYLSPDYYAKLSGLRWESLLGDETGLAFCIDLVKRIEETSGADVLVIDSRTGLTEVGGLCTQILPDTVIFLTNTSRESLRGTQRIHERIRSSSIVKNRLGGRTEVETRVVVTRIPRPRQLVDFEQLMKKKLDLHVERLYFLFDQRDLSVEEYLALDRFDEHPDILDDYVELFASFNPEITLPYVEERLSGFCSQLTRRSVEENERMIQELLTLFPHPEVILEAARYYRLARDGDAKAVENYSRYLDRRPRDIKALSEFVDLSSDLPLRILQPRDRIKSHLRSFGVGRMSAAQLGKFAQLSDIDDHKAIVDAVEKDDEKYSNEEYREVYFRALHALGAWQKIVDSVFDNEKRNAKLSLVLAEAFANSGMLQESVQIIRNYEPEGPDQALALMTLVYNMSPEPDLAVVEDILGSNKRYLRYNVHRSLLARGETNADPGLESWLNALVRQL
jgi:MinD-like ATPase involved in chromosome partitioning or flagellar assembly